MSTMHPTWLILHDDHQSAHDNDLDYQDEVMELYPSINPGLFESSPSAVFSGNFPNLGLSELEMPAPKVSSGPPAFQRSIGLSLDPPLGNNHAHQQHLVHLPGFDFYVAGSGSLETNPVDRKGCHQWDAHRPPPTITELCRFPFVHSLGTHLCADNEVAETLAGYHGSFQREMEPDNSDYEMGLGDNAPESTSMRPRWDAPNSWFIFPSELRNQVYEYTLQLPSSKELYAEYYKEIHAYHARKAKRRLGGSNTETGRDDEPFPVYKANFRAPSILLVCRSITDECLSVLQTRVLTVDRIPPWLPGADRPMRISSFMGRATLQNLRHVDLRLDLGRGRHGSGWIWTWLAEDLLDVLAASNQLTTLRIVIKLFQTHHLRLWELANGETYWYSRLLNKIQWFQDNHSQIWSPPAITVEFWEIRSDWVYLLDSSGRTAVATLGRLPNSELVPGSITDFLTA